MAEDIEILRYAQELSREISPRRLEPATLTWDDRLSLDRVIVRYGEVTLPSGMMGKLTPEEWRPLIASSIIYNHSLHRGQRRGSIVRLALPVGIGEIPLVYALIQIFQMSSDHANIELTLVIAAWTLYACSLFAFYIHWLWRRLFYAADKRAAEIVGAATIVDSLRKSRDVITASKVPRKRFIILPSVNQRLQKLDRFLKE